MLICVICEIHDLKDRNFLVFLKFYDVGLVQETQKFRGELLERLSEDKDEFGDDLLAVVDVCAQVNDVIFWNSNTNFITNVCCLYSDNKLFHHYYSLFPKYKSSLTFFWKIEIYHLIIIYFCILLDLVSQIK